MGRVVGAITVCAYPAAADVPIRGTLGFGDLGTPIANGPPAGDINTATSFTIGDMVSTTSWTGIFVGIPSLDFGSVSFSTTSGTSMDLWRQVSTATSSVPFHSTAIEEAPNSNVPGTVAFYIVGAWTPGLGAWTPGYPDGITRGPYAASFTLSFTQTDGSLSDSGTFSVPEPSTWAMLLAGFVGLGVAGHLASSKRAVAAM